jgi:hypothetical protein
MRQKSDAAFSNASCKHAGQAKEEKAHLEDGTRGVLSRSHNIYSPTTVLENQATTTSRHMEARNLNDWCV